MFTDAHDPGRMRIDKERRRSDRYPLVIPIHLKWLGPGGETHSAHAQAREANLHGGLLEFLGEGKYPIERTEAELMNLGSGHTAKARGTGTSRTCTGALPGGALV